MEPEAFGPSISSMVNAAFSEKAASVTRYSALLDARERAWLLREFRPRQCARLWFFRWLVHTGRLTECPNGWQARRSSLGTEWPYRS